METDKTLTADKLIEVLTQLGDQLRKPDDELNQLASLIQAKNAWFIPQNVCRAVFSIGEMLNRQDLTHWFSLQKQQKPTIHSMKKVGLILAGNIPAVGFHDILCVLVAGHQALIKLSSQDQLLIPYLLKKLIDITPAITEQIQYIDRLQGFDAVIATGSTNTSRYFDYYFRNVPHIIRKNRNSLAVLRGDETQADLKQLGHDIFDYFGLGCRNVSKLYVPTDYDFRLFFEAIETFQWVSNHSKYTNNYDYHKSILLVNRETHLDNGFLLLKPAESLWSPLAVLNYETYEDLASLGEKIKLLDEQIQCVVSASIPELGIDQVRFGHSQRPKLWDYADRANTMDFLFKQAL